MHKNIFPLFITSLGLITAYVFYAVWHTQEPASANRVPQSSHTVESIEQKNVKSNLVQLKGVNKKSSTVKHNETIYKEEPHVASLVYETPEEREELYEALVPDTYDETVTEAQTAFTTLDTSVLEMQEHLQRDIAGIEQIE